MENLTLSVSPIKKLEAIAYAGQPLMNYQYLHGYEDLIEKIPNPLKLKESNFEKGLAKIKQRMEKIAHRALENLAVGVDEGEFKRHVIGVEESLTEGQEIIFAHWGKGFSSPVHGHSEGLLYEFLIQGKMLVHEYIVSNLERKRVRPRKSSIALPGEIVTTFTKPGSHKMHKYESYVHSFEALEPSVSLHYVPEHTRDGRGNTFSVEYFDINPNELKQINSMEAMYSQVGDVLLVRSQNVPFYGDHYIIIIGRPVQKEHGLRPKDLSIQAGRPAKAVLDSYIPHNGVTLLKLSKEERERFLLFHKY